MKLKLPMLAIISITITTSAQAYDCSTQGLRDFGRRYGANGYINNLALYYGEYENHWKKEYRPSRKSRSTKNNAVTANAPKKEHSARTKRQQLKKDRLALASK